MIDISVIIINYNTAELVKKCVESVLSQRHVSYEIIVVDNHSHDMSVATLQQFGANITLIPNADNIGFGKANNQAFQVSRGRFLFMLNPDAMCLTDLDLYHAVQFMESHPQVGLAGTRITDRSGQLESTVYYHYPREKHTMVDFSHLPGEIACVLGASMLARRDVFERVRGFDVSFFLYAEETDLCLRIRQQGYRIGYCESVVVSHVGSASERNIPTEEVKRKKKMGKLLFYRKHYPLADVIKMVKCDLKNARFRLFFLSVIKLFFGLNKNQESKYKQYKVSYELSKNFLMSHE
jgi:GT2 family glycosyltransferase